MYEYACTVDRVVDGDTCDVTLDLGFKILHKCRVRLYGIDTPESRTRNKDEKARGLLAKAYLVDAIESSKHHVVIQTKLKDSKGKFGRVLGDFVSPNGKMITDIMIEEGHAVAYHGQSKDDVKVAHLENRKKLLSEGIILQEDIDKLSKK